jgi:hypothetical protein
MAIEMGGVKYVMPVSPEGHGWKKGVWLGRRLEGDLLDRRDNRRDLTKETDGRRALMVTERRGHLQTGWL